ncbi:MAG: lipid carrier protein [Rhodospirillaceae bacterium]|nr:lipid carrier protein [Rhodospirillaceae bacterium]MBT5660119.1 lipid carrier protein [Rhodospirillaceae bacterium]MBT5751903.1 lipid carrier protein [Rhodospirillaceae bacterium]MBT7942868.1 lipid carrier protein [Alphaproteobacteria bacterium]
MFSSQGKAPPLSPVLLAGLLARPLSPRLLQPLLDAILAVLNRRHPGLFERLSCLKKPVFLIDPVDLPLFFVLDADPSHPRLTATRDSDGRAVAVIRGPLLALIDLLEGRVDGDALFFSRVLSIEGDTEAVVALRNAVDDADIDLRHDILASLGPLAPPARIALNLGRLVYGRLNEDLELLKAAARASQSKGHEA